VEENGVMRKVKKLTLASNGLDAVVPTDNIAFAVRVEGESENKKDIFTRVFLKQVEMTGEAKFVDVREKPEDIF
jgi:hypothetical protein